METEVSRRERLSALLQLVRPANVVTAWADVLAGVAASGAALFFSAGGGPADWAALIGLLVSTTGLYAGGVVLNDVFDATLDARERPERPIPSGHISRRSAALFGGILLLGGILAAASVSWVSGGLAAAIAVAAVVYDAFGKRHGLLGPINMGACRGGNLLLGVSAVPVVAGRLWSLALLPAAYIAAIPAISRGEVHGGRRRTGWLALGLVGGVLAGVLALGVRGDYALLHALPFAALLAVQVGPPFVRAAQTPDPMVIRKAVKAGVLALITLDAALAAGFAGWLYGLVVLLLLPLSIGLGRLFAVT